jgi:23S rRNA pseudouridine1911/1915/1917 synthase
MSPTSDHAAAPPQGPDDGLDNDPDDDPENDHDVAHPQGSGGWYEVALPVSPECHGWRLDRFIKRRIPRLSRTRIQRIIRTQVTRQADRSRALKPSTMVVAGDVLIVRKPVRPEPACPRDVGILHTDPAFYVLDKPAGLPIHPTARYFHNTLTAVLKQRFPGEALQPAHRLDRETSGALVVARGREAGSRLKQSFAARRVEKEYLAVVHGTPTGGQDGGEGVIDLPLALDPQASIKIKMVATVGGLPSETRYRVLRRYGDITLLAARPRTGRQHQIRAHLAAIGCPIVGDKLYGAPDGLFAEWAATGLSEEMLERLLLPRQALHAHRVAFPHPVDGSRVEVVSPLAADLRDFLDGLEAGPEAPSANSA